MQGIMASGGDVVPLGCVPTPLAYWAERSLACDGALIVTGSHNPPSVNGLKISLGGRPFYGEDLKRIYAALDPMASLEKQDIPPICDVRSTYVQSLAAEFSHASFVPKVVWDFGGGAGATLWPELRSILPSSHEALHATCQTNPSRSFDPGAPGALDVMRQVMQDCRYDLGFAFDGDGDRMVVVDSNSSIWSGDETLAFLRAFALDHVARSQGVVADLKSSPFLLDEAQGPVYFSRTGHVFLKAFMKNQDLPLGGEASGHFFFRDRHPGYDDGFYTAFRFMEAASRLSEPLSSWRSDLPCFYGSDELRITVKNRQMNVLFQELKKKLEKEKQAFDDRDGVFVKTPEFWWLIRPSNTEPVLSIRWQAKTKEGEAQVLNMLNAILETYDLSLPIHS
jgi:phosphomannomutase